MKLSQFPPLPEIAPIDPAWLLVAYMEESSAVSLLPRLRELLREGERGIDGGLRLRSHHLQHRWQERIRPRSLSDLTGFNHQKGGSRKGFWDGGGATSQLPLPGGGNNPPLWEMWVLPPTATLSLFSSSIPYNWRILTESFNLVFRLFGLANQGANYIANKVENPHNGPSALLVLNSNWFPINNSPSE